MPSDGRKNRPGYATRAFREYKTYLKTHYETCWVTDEDGKCTQRGLIPDHDPPLCRVPNPTEWRGVLRPMCKRHSDKQSGMLAHGRNYRPIPTRQW